MFKEYLLESKEEEVVVEVASSNAKKFIKEFNNQVKFLKEDIKESESNNNWYGRLVSINQLIESELNKR